MKTYAPFLFVIAALLVGCSLADPSKSVQVTTQPMVGATKTNLALATVRPSVTPQPTQTPSLTPQPTATFPYPVDYASELLLLNIFGSTELHDLIIFRNHSFPFMFTPIGSGDVGYTGPLTHGCGFALDCLWAVSPNGKRAGRVSPDGFTFAMALPPNGPPIFVENGYVINQPEIQTVRLPDVCSQDANSDVEERCDQIQLSQDGRYLAFRYGEDRCGRSMQLIDNQTGEVIYESKGGIHYVGFLPNGVLSRIAGHCQGSFTSFIVPKTRQLVLGGGVGGRLWNQAQSIFVVTEDSFMSEMSTIWGYQLDTGATFYPEGERNYNSDEHVIFLPDDRRFLYQHLRFGVELDTLTTIIDTPAEIVRYDPISGERTVLAADPQYHYRLCQFDYENPCPLQWYGDWIQVQRVPFTPLVPEGEWSLNSLLPCMAEGKECIEPPESFALNAHTGELKPWDPAALPLAYPTPTSIQGPNLVGQPIYTDPDGEYALYVGRDGKSLWKVPKEGPAIQWVGTSKDFFYIP